MAVRKVRPADLREACVREALAIIESAGVEQLSLREVARRLGVSHQAPYKHFRSRDHILAEVVTRAFGEFARYLDRRPKTGDPYADLGEMGRLYFQYARAHPLQYRLMFNTPLPEPKKHPDMMQNAKHAFSSLRNSIADLPLKRGDPAARGAAELDALFVWSTIHGLASILQSHALETLEIPPDVMAKAIPRILMRIGIALEKQSGEPTASIRRVKAKRT